MASRGWLTRFDEPIVLDDGTELATLRDAVRYLARAVPMAERDHDAVLTAADHLTRAADAGPLCPRKRTSRVPTPKSSVDGSRVARGNFDVLALVGCSLLSGLLTQSVETAGPDGVREQGPILLSRL